MSKHSKRKKQTNIALLQKREKFSSLFIKKWLGILFISVLIYVVGLMLFDNYAKTQAKNNFYEMKTFFLETFSQAQKENAARPASNQMRLRLSSLAEGYGITSLLYDTDTKEIIAGCEEQIFLFKKKTDTSPTMIYTCPTSEIPGWEEHRDKLSGYKNSDTVLSETLTISSYYTDGTRLLPDAFSVEVSSSEAFTATYVSSSTGNTTSLPGEFENETAYAPSILYTTQFASPENIPEGYEHFEVDEDYLNPIIVGYSKNSPYVKEAGTDYAYELLQSHYNSIKDGTALPFSIDLYEENVPFQLTLLSRSDLTLNTGQDATLLSAYHLDIWDTYGKWLVLAAVILFVLGLFWALLLSHLSYTRLKAQYDMIDYRKTLMNTMAHDLKSPLMSILGYAENLKENVHSEKREYYSDAILDNVQHMNHLIDSVLALAKSEKDGIRLKKEAVDIKALIQESLKKYELQLSEASISPVLTGSLTLSVDPVLFTQAMDNLITNAIKYASTDSTLEIRLSKSAICFSNSCKEDLSDVIDTLCEPFVTADQSRSSKKGSGLGLTIVKNICDFHGFQFKVSYKTANKETTHKEGIFEAIINL